MAQDRKHEIAAIQDGYAITHCRKRVWVGNTGIGAADLDAIVNAGTVEVCQVCADAKAKEDEG